MDWVDVTVLLLRHVLGAHWGSWERLWGGSFMPPFSGKEGQARMQPHAHTQAHSHTHTPPCLGAGEGTEQPFE